MENTVQDLPLKKSKLQGSLKKVALVLLLLIIGLLIMGLLTNETVNLVVMGVEGTRTDTILFVSINTKNNKVDVISIPRDTYFPTEGKNGLGQKKINAVYGFKEIGGANGVVKAISSLLGTKVDYFVKLDYDGVSEIVDLIGGVEVDVPMRMKYDDPYSKPPLHIDFQPGLQTIMGKDAMAYLRFRKSNDNTYSGGDIKRMERQQDFMKSASKKLISFKLPYIALRGMQYVETDMPLQKAVLIATAMIGTKEDQITLTTLPVDYTGTGKDGLSYFYHDKDATKSLIESIMNP